MVLACLLKKQLLISSPPCIHSDIVVVVIIVVWMIKKGGVSQISIKTHNHTQNNVTSRFASLDRILTDVLNAPLSRSRSRYTNERSGIDDT